MISCGIMGAAAILVLVGASCFISEVSGPIGEGIAWTAGKKDEVVGNAIRAGTEFEDRRDSGQSEGEKSNSKFGGRRT